MPKSKPKTVVDELIEVINYLAPPTPEDGHPDRRARCGFECGATWDGGKRMQQTDAWIARVVKRARTETSPLPVKPRKARRKA